MNEQQERADFEAWLASFDPLNPNRPSTTLERNEAWRAWKARAALAANDHHAEIQRLTECLKKANDQAEHFEREWYFRGDVVERQEARIDALQEDLSALAANVPADPHLMAKHNALHMNHIALKAQADKLARGLHTGLGALICAGSNDECQSLEVYAKQVMREALSDYDASGHAGTVKESLTPDPAPAPEAAHTYTTEQLARAWYAIGADVAGLEWGKLVKALAAAPAPEADPCIYPACQTNGCREACEAPAQAQQSAEPLTASDFDCATEHEREAFFTWYDYAFDPDLDEGKLHAFAAGMRAGIGATPAQEQQSVPEGWETANAVGDLMLRLSQWKATNPRTAPPAWAALVEACRAMVAASDAEQAEQAQAQPVGCSYCQHPLFAATKCLACGYVPAPAQQFVEDQAARDNAILEKGIQVGRTRERQLWEHEAATKAKPEAQQPLTWEQFVAACEAEYGEDFAPEGFMGASDDEKTEIMRVARMVERICAEAWGVKLGASGESQG